MALLAGVLCIDRRVRLGVLVAIPEGALTLFLKIES
jgi:hypothetical protein